MQAASSSPLELEKDGSLPGVRWYAAYTSAHHERRIAEQFTGRNVEFFLPQYETPSRRKDRRVQLSLPLFPGYIFVHIALGDRLRILEVPGVVRLVGCNGLPTPLPEADMERLRRGLAAFPNAIPHPFLTVGRRVRIIRGPLEGLEGVLLRRKGAFRVVLSLQLIQRSICLDVDTDAVQPIL